MVENMYSGNLKNGNIAILQLGDRTTDHCEDEGRHQSDPEGPKATMDVEIGVEAEQF